MTMLDTDAIAAPAPAPVKAPWHDLFERLLAELDDRASSIAGPSPTCSRP